MIDGPSRQPALKEFFETDQQLTAKHLANEFNLKYRSCDSFQKLDVSLSEIAQPTDCPFILEIETDPATNKKVYREVIGILSQFN